MKKRKAFKSFILGFLFAAILFGTVVMANPALREIVYGVRVSFNGVPVVFDAGMEPFIMEGRTFLPVRTVAEMVGLHVDFIDGIVYLTPEGGTRPSVAATPAPVRGENDLGGMVINIGNWWSDECTETFSPSLNSYSEATIARWNDRRVQEQLYNFRIREVRYGSWHDVRDDVQAQLLAENRDYQVWVLEPTWFYVNNVQGLFAPIPPEFFNDDLGIEWNHGVINLTMRNGMPHGFSFRAEPSGGMFFNMRLLEEAGFERDLPFRLQAENNWTWETFTEIARQVSDHFEFKHIKDVWAITSFHQDVLRFALASNGADYAVVNPVTGRFENTSTSDAFRETMEWVISLREEGLAMTENDLRNGEWNFFIQEFDEGRGVFRVAENYVAMTLQLDDDWGFVAFPRGPRSDVHLSPVRHNIYAIPYFYSEQEVRDIMFAMQRWIRPLENEDDWMLDAYEFHPDRRSVDETMALYTRNPELQSMPAHELMPGLSHTIAELFAWRVWIGNDADVIISEAQQVWNAFIERVNNIAPVRNSPLAGAQNDAIRNPELDEINLDMPLPEGVMYSLRFDPYIQSFNVGTINESLIFHTPYLDSAGRPTYEIVEGPYGNAINISNRDADYYAVDFVSDAVNWDFENHSYTLTVVGNTGNGDSFIIGGGDSPWARLAIADADEDGYFAVTYTLNNRDDLDAAGSRRRFRLLENGLENFEIYEILVERWTYGS